jgi:predicted aspartyl protease
MTTKTMTGSVDHLKRPIFRLRVDQQDDELLVMIDTGFNGQLMLTAEQASALQVKPFGYEQPVMLGDGSEIKVGRGSITIEWFGRLRTVDVHIAPKSAKPHRQSAPLALLGTSLIFPDTLDIRFGRQTVTLRQEA